MIIFGIILAIIYILIFIILYAFGVVSLKKKKYYLSVKLYYIRFFYEILFIFIGYLPLYLITKEDMYFDVKCVYLIVLIAIPYIYDFVYLSIINKSILPYKDLDIDSKEYEDACKALHIDKIDESFKGKGGLYSLAVGSIVLYLVLFVFFDAYIVAIFG